MIRSLFRSPANSASVNAIAASSAKTASRAAKIAKSSRASSAGSNGASNGGSNRGSAAKRTDSRVEALLENAEKTKPAIIPKSNLAVLQDGKLVQQCLAHQPGAWSRMYSRFHSPLVASVRAFLGPAGRDPYLIDEVAARVWYALVRDDFWLLARFDVRRGCRFSTFLSLIGKAQARLLLRSERRRRLREQAVAKSEIEEPADGRLDSLSGEEFVATLSPAERTFLIDVLVASSDCNARDRYSNQNLWQLRRRVREKLLKFLE